MVLLFPTAPERLSLPGAGKRKLCSMADDGDSSSGPVDTNGGQGAAEESDGLSLGGMFLNISVLILVVAVCLAVYRRWGRRLVSDGAHGDEAPMLTKMRRRDFTLEQLREYDGVQNPRILMAVNMKVFDVTSGKKFYGKGEATADGKCRTVELVDTLPPVVIVDQKLGANRSSLAPWLCVILNGVVAASLLAYISSL